MPKLPKQVSEKVQKSGRADPVPERFRAGCPTYPTDPGDEESMTHVSVDMNHTVYTVGRAPSPAKRLSRKPPKVSAIVVNWNGMEFLPTCLDSLSKQSYKNLEVIVVDCASRDESVSWIAENYPRTKVIVLQKDPGPPAAINLAAKQAKGKYIAILNNDIYLPPDLIKRLSEELQRDENCVVTPVELNWKGEYVRSGCPEPWISSFLSKFFRVKGATAFYPSTACCLVSKRILLENPLNEKLFLYEDTEWGWRLQLKGVNVKVLPDASFVHKDQGTVGKSKKLAFILGRTPIATQFICFRFSTFLAFFPLTLVLYYLSPLRILRYLKNSPLSLFYFYKGFVQFFIKFPYYLPGKRKVQAERTIGDWKVLKIMIGSTNYKKRTEKEWLERNRTKKEENLYEQQTISHYSN